MTEPTHPEPDPIRRRLGFAALGLGALLSAGAVYNGARFWWLGRGFEIPPRFLVYSFWLLPAGAALLIAGGGLRSGRRGSWLLVILAALWIPAVLILAPQGYFYFLKPDTP